MKKELRCKFVYYDAVYQCPNSSGTVNLIRHLNTCIKFKLHDISQMFIGRGGNSMSLVAYKM